MRRYALRNDQWERIQNILPGREGSVGVTAKDNRCFVEAVLYRYRAVVHGVIYQNALEISGSFTQGILVGVKLASGSMFSNCLQKMLIMNMQ